MDEVVRFKLSQIQIERMELKSTLKEISYLMQIESQKDLSKEADKILDRLEYLEMIEKKIRKRLKQ
jgi:hypothetical protein